MLPRPKRLTRAGFGHTATGKRAISAHFSVSYSPSEDARAAAVVSKKVAKKAVDRHLLKRRMLESARPHLLPGRSFVLYARQGAPSLPFPSLRDEINTLLMGLPKV
jgi:ribonuclease P protein component